MSVGIGIDYRPILNLVLLPILIVMSFIGSSAAELGIGKTHLRLLWLLDCRSVMDGVTYLHRLSHNDSTAGMTTALARQVSDRAVLSR